MSDSTLQQLLNDQKRMNKQALKTFLLLAGLIFIGMNVYIQLTGSHFQRIAIPVETVIATIVVVIGIYRLH